MASNRWTANENRARREKAARDRHWTCPPLIVAMARKGTNPTCLDCDHQPLAGGLRCGPCFSKVAEPERTPISIS